MSEYYTELTGLWEELEHYRHVLPWVCPVKCNCAATKNSLIFREQDYIVHFLTRLNDEYENARS